MRSMLKLAAATAALAATAGCGDDRGADGLTAEERRKLDEHAANLDAGADVVDASPDSLVANEAWTEAETAEADNGTATNGQ